LRKRSASKANGRSLDPHAARQRHLLSLLRIDLWDQWQGHHRSSAERASPGASVRRGDDGSNALIASEVIRRNELQVWFVAEHVVPLALAQAK
jgi:hypothetical protein